MLGLLTALPVLYVANVDEGSAASGNEFSRKVEARAKAEGAACVVISAKIEAEIAVLPATSATSFSPPWGSRNPASIASSTPAMRFSISSPTSPLGRRRRAAWTITRGTKAPQAAGVIHSDFEHGFIRAETIAYDDYVACGGEAGARDAGKMRLEGKDYVVADGDVMHFRFAN